jgi:hypothetical protein
MEGMRLLALWLALSPSLVLAEEGVRLILLPTRRADAPALRERLESVGHTFSERTGQRLLEEPRQSLISSWLAEAAELDGKGEIDRASALFDRVIDEVRLAPQRIEPDRTANFVAAVVKRASIAIARNEPPAQAARLLSDLLLYDPTFTLLPNESSPPLRRAFDEAQPLAASARVIVRLGGVCAGSTLLVGRAQDSGVLEISRFDNCQRIGNPVRLAPGDFSAESLLGPKTVAPSTPRAGVAATVAVSTAWLLAFVGAGGALVATAGKSYDALAATPCGQAHTCQDAESAGPRRDEQIGWSLIGVGLGGAMIAATVGGIVLSRKPAKQARVSSGAAF